MDLDWTLSGRAWAHSPNRILLGTDREVQCSLSSWPAVDGGCRSAAVADTQEQVGTSLVDIYSVEGGRGRVCPVWFSALA